MNFKQIKIDWIDILQTGIIYTQVNWLALSVTDKSINTEGLHARHVSPTYARVRIITIEWVVDRIFGDEEEKINHLRNIFALQSNMSALEEKQVYIKDSFDNEWKIQAKIKKPIELSEWDKKIEGSHWKWRVVLESTYSPLYFSANELQVSSSEGNYGGFTLAEKLWIPFNKKSGAIEVNTLKTQTYTRFEIDVKWTIDTPLTILNTTNKTRFSLDITAHAGDKIIIDSENYTATKNGVSILDKRIPWSIWQKISGKNTFVVFDTDRNLGQDDVDIIVYYSNALL